VASRGSGANNYNAGRLKETLENALSTDADMNLYVGCIFITANLNVQISFTYILYIV